MRRMQLKTPKVVITPNKSRTNIVKLPGKVGSSGQTLPTDRGQEVWTVRRCYWSLGLNVVCAVVSVWCAVGGGDRNSGRQSKTAVFRYGLTDVLRQVVLLTVGSLLVNIFGALVSFAAVDRQRRTTLRRTFIVVVYGVWCCAATVVLLVSAAVVRSYKVSVVRTWHVRETAARAEYVRELVTPES